MQVIVFHLKLTVEQVKVMFWSNWNPLLNPEHNVRETRGCCWRRKGEGRAGSVRMQAQSCPPGLCLGGSKGELGVGGGMGGARQTRLHPAPSCPPARPPACRAPQEGKGKRKVCVASPQPRNVDEFYPGSCLGRFLPGMNSKRSIKV